MISPKVVGGPIFPHQHKTIIHDLTTLFEFETTVQKEEFGFFQLIVEGLPDWEMVEEPGRQKQQSTPEHKAKQGVIGEVI
jgi:hypothetical protein